MARRTKQEIERERMYLWIMLGTEGWAMHSTCGSCGECAHVRGKTKQKLRCETCFMKGR